MSCNGFTSYSAVKTYGVQSSGTVVWNKATLLFGSKGFTHSKFIYAAVQDNKKKEEKIENIFLFHKCKYAKSRERVQWRQCAILIQRK